jgi:hypothetical protein
MKKLLALVVAVALPLFVHAEGTESLAPKLQNVSVTVHSEDGQGSGTIVTRSGTNFVLTAGHVVAANRVITKLLVDGNVKMEVSFIPVTVVKEIYADGRSVGSLTVEGEVIAYSSSEYGDDVALLKLRSKVTDASAEFYTGELVQPGTPIVHVGSLLGQEGSNSFTTGEMSQIGRVLFDKVFDQVNCVAYPGSSGGGLFLKQDGRYIGMLVRGAGPGLELIVPVRRIQKWAKEHTCEFVLNPKAAVGAVKLETKEPIGDTPVSEDGENKFPFLLAR